MLHLPGAFRTTFLMLICAALAGACDDSPSGVECDASSVTVAGLPSEIPALTQFPLTVSVQPEACQNVTVHWTASPGLTIDSQGRVTASVLGGPFTVTATAGGAQGSAETVVGTAPVVIDNRWAIAWMDSPGAANYEISLTGYPYASTTGSAIRGARSAVGSYSVTFAGLASHSGQRETIQVSAYGSEPRRCRVLSWANQGADLVAQVRCHDFNGALADSYFDIMLMPAGSTEGRSAFLVNSSTAGGNVAAATAHNSESGYIKSEHSGTGVYEISFGGLARLANPGAGAETFHVTAYGSGTSWCKIQGWGEDEETGDMILTVYCFTTTGAPVDATFSVAMIERGRTGKRLGFVWANNADNAVPYTPVLSYSYNSVAGLNQSVLNGTGQYDVSWPGLARPIDSRGETNLVTAYGNDSVYCQVEGWGSASVGQLCFTTAGVPANSRFTAIWIE